MVYLVKANSLVGNKQVVTNLFLFAGSEIVFDVESLPDLLRSLSLNNQRF